MGKATYTQEDLELMELSAAAMTSRAIEEATPEEHAAGMGWYAVAQQWAKMVGEAAGFTGTRAIYRGAGAIGVLSPRVRWAENLDDAMAIATDDFDHNPRAFGTNIRKAMVILAHDVSDSEAEEEIGGQKVIAFIDNIRKPLHSQAVVLDTHMCTLFGIAAYQLELKGVYEALARGIRTAAHAHHIRPCQAQAIAWVVTRGPEKENVI